MGSRSLAAKKAWATRKGKPTYTAFVSKSKTRKSKSKGKWQLPKGVKFPYYDKKEDILWTTRNTGFRHPKKWKGHEAVMSFLSKSKAKSKRR
jgi:hypothetical protein